MERIKPVPYQEWDWEVLRPLTYGEKVPPSDSLGLLLHNPELAKAFLTFSTHLLAKNSLPKRIRELTILRTAWRARCRFEWAHHVQIGRRHGVTDEDLKEVKSGAPTLVNRAVDEVLDDSRLSDESYALLAAELTEPQILDFLFTVGGYAGLAAVYNTFDIDLDAGLPDGGFDD